MIKIIYCFAAYKLKVGGYLWGYLSTSHQLKYCNIIIFTPYVSEATAPHQSFLKLTKASKSYFLQGFQAKLPSLKLIKVHRLSDRFGGRLAFNQFGLDTYNN